MVCGPAYTEWTGNGSHVADRAISSADLSENVLNKMNNLKKTTFGKCIDTFKQISTDPSIIMESSLQLWVTGSWILYKRS